MLESRRGHLDYRIKRDYVRQGIATIPCQVSNYNDVINQYSVKDWESLNPEFVDYVKEIAELTPPECPLVLDIIADSLSQEEKEIIKETILDDFAYDLGVVEWNEKRHARIFGFMLIGLILLVVLLMFTRSMGDEPRELIFVLFYFIGDTLCDYIFLTGHDLRRERQLAGRLASIRVVFSESYEMPNYTESDVEKLYSEIEKDVNGTLQKEDDN